MTLSKCAKLELQVQSVVARVKFSHEGTRSLYQTLGKQLQKLSSFFFEQLAKHFLVLVSPPPLSGCQAQDVNISKNKYDVQYGKVNNNAIK
jgi:hypothetical protein